MNRRRLAAILIALGLAAALYLALPRPNQLVPYTTQPLNERGDRVSLLIPRGWAKRERDVLGAATFEPQDSSPFWLQRFGIGRAESNAVLKVDLLSPQDCEGLSSSFFHEEVIDNSTMGEIGWSSTGYVKGPGQSGAANIDYARERKGAFDDTHEAIFQSVRIIPGGGKR